MPNKIHRHRRRLNLHELVMHAMIPFFRSFIFLQLRSHHFQVFHRGCLCLHYLLRANPMHWLRSTLHYYMYPSRMNHHCLLWTHHHPLLEQIEPMLSLTFTCTVADCGERLTHQFYIHFLVNSYYTAKLCLTSFTQYLLILWIISVFFHNSGVTTQFVCLKCDFCGVFISDIQVRLINHRGSNRCKLEERRNARKLAKVGCVVGRIVRQVILQVLMIV